MCGATSDARHAARRTDHDAAAQRRWPVHLIDKVADVIVCDGAEKAPQHVPTPDVLNATYEALDRVDRGLIAINVQESDLAGLAPRASLADIAATIAEVFATERPEIGTSFLKEVQRCHEAAEATASRDTPTFGSSI